MRSTNCVSFDQPPVSAKDSASSQMTGWAAAEAPRSATKSSEMKYRMEYLAWCLSLGFCADVFQVP